MAVVDTSLVKKNQQIATTVNQKISQKREKQFSPHQIVTFHQPTTVDKEPR